MKTELALLPAKITFEYSKRFERDIKALGKKYRTIVNDLDNLLAVLEAAPQTGTPLGRDCYKIRMAISSKQAGKSGGARVITCVKLVQEKIYLLSIFDKGEQDTVTDKELEAMLKESGAG